MSSATSGRRSRLALGEQRGAVARALLVELAPRLPKNISQQRRKRRAGGRGIGISAFTAPTRAASKTTTAAPRGARARRPSRASALPSRAAAPRSQPRQSARALPEHLDHLEQARARRAPRERDARRLRHVLDARGPSRRARRSCAPRAPPPSNRRRAVDERREALAGAARSPGTRNFFASPSRRGPAARGRSSRGARPPRRRCARARAPAGIGLRRTSRRRRVEPALRERTSRVPATYSSSRHRAPGSSGARTAMAEELLRVELAVAASAALPVELLDELRRARRPPGRRATSRSAPGSSSTASRRVALLAVLGHAHGAVPLRELLAVRREHHRQVRELRRRARRAPRRAGSAAAC